MLKKKELQELTIKTNVFIDKTITSMVSDIIYRYAGEMRVKKFR